MFGCFTLPVGAKMTTNPVRPLPKSISQQSRPTPDGSGPAPVRETSYSEAIASFSGGVQVKTDLLVAECPEVTAEQVASSIMRFLEGVADDEGGNAAKYFPAILVSRMSRRVADDINAARSLETLP